MKALILLDTKYVSPLLTETLVEKNITIFDIQQNVILGNRLTGEKSLVEAFQQEDLIIMNSEEAFHVLNNCYASSHVTKMANLFKNKVAFRECLAEHYPDFFFLETSLGGLYEVDRQSLPYPIILKPSVGYSSVGVYRLENETEFLSVLSELRENMQQSSGNYSVDVLDSNTFIIESYIEGREFAIDLYYDVYNEPVILNLFARMFKDDQDMSDRIYYTSKQVVQSYLSPITDYLHQLGNLFNLKKMPLHIEVRIDDKGKIIPIEVNPLRFAGAGTTELGHFAYGVNPYDYFFDQKKPNWSELIKGMDDRIYSFTCAEFESGLKIDDQYIVHHDRLKEQFHHILEYRHIPYDSGTTFAVIFFSSDSLVENNHILTLDFMDFVEEKKSTLVK